MNKKIKSESKTLIISIESQKGGVGKTTAAFCLGKLLIEEDYEVLMLDLDITGTNAGIVAKNSDFYNKYSEPVICLNSGKDKETNKNNLIFLFERYFMSGLTIPKFTYDPQGNKSFLLSRGDVNVFGSSIYNSDGNRVIARPEVLFDELHSYWLIEFIQHIIENFEKTGMDTKKAVIIDSSPGYVGLTPAIQDWLTDRGPDCSKFLSVLTLDEHDMLATSAGINSLIEKYNDKWKTKLTFDNLSKPDATEEKVENDEFFMRLATANELPFYKQGIGKKYSKNFEKYIGAVINLVPLVFYKRNLTYKINTPPENKSLHDNLIKIITGKNHSSYWRDRMVSFDHGLKFQNISGGIISSSRVRNMTQELNTALDKIQNGKSYIKRQSRKMDHLRYSPIELRRTYNESLGGIIRQTKALLSDLQTLGLDYILELIEPEWLPEFIIPEARQALRIISSLPSNIFWEDALEIDTDLNNKAADFLNNLDKSVVSLLSKYQDENRGNLNNDDELLIGSFNDYLCTLTTLSLTTQVAYSDANEDIVELLAMVLHFEIEHWKQKKKSKFDQVYEKTINDSSNSTELSIASFLAKETVSHPEIERYIKSTKFKSTAFKLYREKNTSEFRMFYEKFTTLQARLMTVHQDANFIVKLLEITINKVSNDRKFIPYFHKAVDDVIVNKSLPHKNALLEIDKMIDTGNYYLRFYNVLESICKKWEMI